jgi:hypothetical protein
MDRDTVLRARVEGDCHAEVRVAEGPYLEFVCIGLEGLNQVVRVALVSIAKNAKIIDYGGEHNVASDVPDCGRPYIHLRISKYTCRL